MDETTQPLLRIEALERGFSGRSVLRGLSLAVEPGERVAVLGPNGSGKTTLLRCIAGTLAPDAGEVAVAGHPAGTLAARRLVGLSLSHERSFYLRLSGRANLLFYARIRSGSAEAARDVAAVEEELELAFASERVDRYSAGMLQQLALARALLAHPRLLLLDEPTRSLDEDAYERAWAALDRRPAAAAVIATHRADDVDRCSRSVELH